MEGGVKVFSPPSFFNDMRASENWFIDPMSISGGVSLLGDEQVIGPLAGRWRCDLTLQLVDEAYSDESTRATAEAFLSRLRGKQNAFRIRHGVRSYRERSGYAYKPTSHSDGTFFSDGSGYTNSAPVFGSVLALPARATSVRVNHGLYAAPRVNDCINVNRQMVKVVGIFPVSTGTTDILFEPPLRVSAPIGSQVDFEGTVVMKLDADASGRIERVPASLLSSKLALVETREAS